MATTKLIKQVFGNHDIGRRYIQFIRNPRNSLPPFPPVLYRQIAHGEDTEINILIHNILSQHHAQTKQVITQLKQLYNDYSILRE